MKDKNERYTICVDFDGVLNSYSSPWQEDSIPDPPVPGAMEWLRSMMQKFEVVIFTTRARTADGCWLVRGWLERYGFSNDEARSLAVTNEKPAALIYIDDRAYRFTGANFPTAHEIHRLRSWTKP